jgi:hypothetical protein
MSDSGQTVGSPAGSLRISPARRASDIVVAAVLLVLRTMRVVASGPEVTAQGEVRAPEVVFHAEALNDLEAASQAGVETFDNTRNLRPRQSAARTAGIAADHLLWAATSSDGTRA